MAKLLNVIYSAVVLFVALAGLVYTFGVIDRGGGGSKWMRWAGIVVVGAFLVGMIWLTIA